MAIKSNKRLGVCASGMIRKTENLEFGNYYKDFGVQNHKTQQ